MSKRNVVLPDGRIVSVDEDVAEASQLPDPGLPGEAAAAAGEYNKERSSGFVEGAKSFGEGLADTVSLGTYGAVRGALDDEYARNASIRGTERSGMRFAGEAAGLLAPTGIFGDTIKGAAEFTGLGAAELAGEGAGALGGRYVGKAVEGAVIGAGGTLAQTNVTGDPLTIESIVEGAGIGAILNVGGEAIANKLYRAGGKAMARQWEAADAATALNRDVETATAAKGTGLLKGETDLPSWNEFRDSHIAAQDAAETFNNKAAKAATEYRDFAEGADLGKALRKAQSAVDEVRNRYAAEASNAKWIEGKPRSEMTGYDAEGKPSRILTNQKPPISPAIKNELDNFSGRISEAIKTKGGGVRLDGGRWVPDATVVPDPVGALEKLRGLQSEFATRYPLASSKFTDLPAPPPQPVPLERVALPRRLADFPRMHAETVARLANNIDPTAAQAFGRLADDIGVARGATPAETIAGVHAKLGEYTGAVDRLSARTKDIAAREAKKPLMLRIMRQVAARSAGAMLGGAVGGHYGALIGAIGGGQVARAMEGAETAALEGAMLQSKSTLRNRLSNVVAKYAVPSGDAIKKLTPVTAYLSTSFPLGHKDPERDIGKRAVNRMTELRAAAQTAPDDAFVAIDSLLGHPGDVGLKLHQHIVGTLQHLISTLPQDPGIDVHMFQSNWTPAHHDAVALAHRLEAVQDPVNAIVRALAGDGHPAATETLWTVYPAMMNELSQEFALAAPRLTRLSYQQASAYSDLFRTPMTGLQHPIVVNTIQGLYLPKPSMMQPPSGGNGSGGTGGPPGRPAAVQSPVAGSSVAGLIH